MTDARRRPMAERLWARVVKTEDGCWEWQGFCNEAGYGQISRGARSEGLEKTHRAAWTVTRGPIPPGMFVCHACDNPRCCNPDHLFLGTCADNVRDMVTKGRGAKGASLPHTRLTEAEVRHIRTSYIPRFGPPKRGGRRSNADELAEEFGISRAYVLQLVHGHFRKDA